MSTHEKPKAKKAVRGRKRTGLFRVLGVLAAAVLLFASGYLLGRSPMENAAPAESAGAVIPVKESAEEPPVSAEQESEGPSLPAFSSEGGYFPCEGGFFRPEAPLTREEGAMILYSALAEKPETEPAPLDLAETSGSASAITAMVKAGYLSLADGYFYPQAELTGSDIAEFLSVCFPEDRIQQALPAIRGYGDDSITHAEAAVLFNKLFGVAVTEDTVYLPDVAVDSYFARDVFAACKGNGPETPAAEGFFNREGYLYHIGADGFLTRNDYIGSLYFGADGRYTSGSAELDDAVAAAIRTSVDPAAGPEEQLRAAYGYVRDSFSYLKGSLYNMGDSTWALEEAVKIYTTGMGNCYSFAAGFWAIARGLGYDAMVVSGTVGKEVSPHGWVEIPMDDGRYVFDVELEMAYKRDNRGNINMFKLEEVSARYSWLYNKNANANLSTPGRNIAAQ